MSEHCICGAELWNLFGEANDSVPPEDRRYVWKHVTGSGTLCTEPRWIADEMPDRKLTQAAAEQMAILTNRTHRAAGELETIQSTLAEMLYSTRELGAALNQPATVRRNTLTEVWDALMTAGNLSGARLVRDMIRGL